MGDEEHYFRVKITNFRVVIENWTKRSAETLLKGNFDGQKSFRTESIRGNQPIYKSTQLFDYSIRATDLSTRFFTIDLVDIFETELPGGVIATTKIDILTCATGPQQHQLNLFDEHSKAIARLDLVLQMENISEMGILLKDITIPSLYSVNALQNKKLTMVLCHNNKPDQYQYFEGSKYRVRETNRAFAGKTNKKGEPVWSSIDPVHFDNSLPELMRQDFIIKLKDNPKGNDSLCSVALSMKRFILACKGLSNVPLVLDETMKDDRGQEVGKLQGTFTFLHLPRYAQMLGGRHYDDRIENPIVLFPGAVLPPRWSIETGMISTAIDFVRAPGEENLTAVVTVHDKNVKDKADKKQKEKEEKEAKQKEKEEKEAEKQRLREEKLKEKEREKEEKQKEKESKKDKSKDKAKEKPEKEKEKDKGGSKLVVPIVAVTPTGSRSGTPTGSASSIAPSGSGGSSTSAPASASNVTQPSSSLSLSAGSRGSGGGGSSTGVPSATTISRDSSSTNDQNKWSSFASNLLEPPRTAPGSGLFGGVSQGKVIDADIEGGWSRVQDALDAAFPNHWRVPLVSKPSQSRLSQTPSPGRDSSPVPPVRSSSLATSQQPAQPLPQTRSSPLSQTPPSSAPSSIPLPVSRSTELNNRGSGDGVRTGQLGLALPPAAKDLQAPKTPNRYSAYVNEVQARRSTDPPPPVATASHDSGGSAVTRLPEGWEARTDAQGRVFYVDHNTHTTHWVAPQPQPTKPLLPPGWSQAADPQGRVYYVNHNSKTTHWVLPPNVLAWIEQNRNDMF